MYVIDVGTKLSDKAVQKLVDVFHKVKSSNASDVTHHQFHLNNCQKVSAKVQTNTSSILSKTNLKGELSYRPPLTITLSLHNSAHLQNDSYIV